MQNKLSNLNNHLFAQLERISDEDTKGDELKEEMERAKSVTNVAHAIINNAKLLLDAQKALEQGLFNNAPEVLGITKK